MFSIITNQNSRTLFGIHHQIMLSIIPTPSPTSSDSLVNNHIQHQSPNPTINCTQQKSLHKPKSNPHNPLSAAELKFIWLQLHLFCAVGFLKFIWKFLHSSFLNCIPQFFWLRFGDNLWVTYNNLKSNPHHQIRPAHLTQINPLPTAESIPNQTHTTKSDQLITSPSTTSSITTL